MNFREPHRPLTTVPPVVLLTATVHPHAQSRLTLTDPEQRQAQYNLSLTHWLKAQRRYGFRLALADNSPKGSVITIDLPDAADADARLLRLPQAAVPARDKGGREAILLNQAIAALDLAPDTWIIKCTGRLWLRNPESALRDWKGGSIVVRATADLQYVDSRLFKFRRRFWDAHLRHMETTISEQSGRYMEHVLGRRLSKARAEGHGVGRFHTRPRLQGQSGTTGAVYGDMPDALRRLTAAPYETLMRRFESRKQY